MGLSLEKTHARLLVCTCSRCFFLKEVVIFGNPLILVMLVSKLQVDLDQVENEATPYIMHAVNNIGVVSG